MWGPAQKSRGGSSNRAEQAKLASTLLEASKNAPKIQGKIVNDYGQEEVLVPSIPAPRCPCPCPPAPCCSLTRQGCAQVGVSRWQQKQAMVRDMYARNNSTPDMNHEQRVM